MHKGRRSGCLSSHLTLSIYEVSLTLNSRMLVTSDVMGVIYSLQWVEGGAVQMTVW
jgi:hypothetical protein